LLLTVPMPRMRMLPSLPGAPELVVTITPAALPCYASVALTGVAFDRSFALTEEIAPVTSDLRWVP